MNNNNNPILLSSPTQLLYNYSTSNNNTPKQQSYTSNITTDELYSNNNIINNNTTNSNIDLIHNNTHTDTTMHYQPSNANQILNLHVNNISHTHSTSQLIRLLSFAIDKNNGYITEQCIINYRYKLHKVLIESLFGYVVVGSDMSIINNNNGGNTSNQYVCIKISNKILCNKHQSVRGDNVVDNVKREAAMMYYLQPNNNSNINQQHNNTQQQQQHRHNNSDASSNTHMYADTDVDCDTSDDDSVDVVCEMSRLSTSSSTRSINSSENDNNNNKTLQQQLYAKQQRIYNPSGSRYLCKLIQELEDNELHVLVTEYCSGSDLFDVILKNGPVDDLLSKHIFKQICLSVQHMHNKHIAHLDISLENICETKQGEIRLIDFGSSAIHPYDITDNNNDNNNNDPHYLSQFGYSIQPIQQSNTSIFPCIPSRRKPGKKAYMSPELYSGRDGWLGSSNQSFDAYSVDIWSLGVILYTLLTGHPPFEKPDPNQDAWFRFIYTGRWLHPESRMKKNSSIYRNLDENVLQLINSILKPQHQRPSINDILNSAWLSDLNNLTVEQYNKLNRMASKLAISQQIIQ